MSFIASASADHGMGRSICPNMVGRTKARQVRNSAPFTLDATSTPECADTWLCSRLTAAPRTKFFNAPMRNERPQPRPTEKDAPPKQEKGGRSGEGARSVIPHLRADHRARAVARIPKRLDRDL
jgi:hypothetical protein